MNLAPTATLTDVRALLELAGYALCQGIWVLQQPMPLPPVVMADGDSGRALVRMSQEPDADALLITRANLDSLGACLKRSVILFDGYVRDGGQAVDAVVAEARLGGRPGVVRVLQRYRPADHPEGFAILGEPLFGQRMPAEIEGPAVMALLAGMRQHPATRRLWEAHFEADPASPWRQAI